MKLQIQLDSYSYKLDRKLLDALPRAIAHYLRLPTAVDPVVEKNACYVTVYVTVDAGEQLSLTWQSMYQ